MDRSTYRPDIDGLRAVSVLAVLTFHVRPSWLPGGFLGVDVFFVISGFVITRLLLDEIATGAPLRTFLATFYQRRVMRIMPLYAAVSLATLAVGWFLLLPADFARLSDSAFYGAQFRSNAWFADTVGYFQPIAESQGLLHTWSLSIEEQFYLTWPVLLFALTHRMGKRGRWHVLVVMTAILIALSYALAGTGTDHQAYFQLRARAYEPLLGACLAVWLHGREPAPGRGTGAVAIASVLGLVAAFLVLRPGLDLPGLPALWPTACTVAVIYTGATTTLVRRLLGIRPLVGIGKLSYSLYLVHWPILCFVRYLGVEAGALAVVACFAVAFATFTLIEQPLRHRRWRLSIAVAVFVVVPAALVSAVKLADVAGDGFADRLSPVARETMRIQRTFAHEARQRCHARPEPLPPADCTLGAPGPASAVLWGDSHANHYAGFVDALGIATGTTIRDITTNACPPFASDAGACTERNAVIVRYLLDTPEIRTVVLAASWSRYVADDRAGAERGLRDTVALLQRHDKRVVMLAEMPELPLEQVDCPLKAAFLDVGLACEFADPIPERDREIAPLLRATGALVLDPTALVCDGTTCRQLLDGVPLYRLGDRGHLNMEGSAVLGRAFLRRYPHPLDPVDHR